MERQISILSFICCSLWFVAVQQNKAECSHLSFSVVTLFCCCLWWACLLCCWLPLSCRIPPPSRLSLTPPAAAAAAAAAVWPCSSWRSCSTTPSSCTSFFLCRRAWTRSCSISSACFSSWSGCSSSCTSTGFTDGLYVSGCRDTRTHFIQFAFYCLSVLVVTREHLQYICNYCHCLNLMKLFVLLIWTIKDIWIWNERHPK